MQRLEVDPISKKQKPEYRWAQQELTDDAYKDHLIGTKSIGIQPCNEKNHARFGAIDIGSSALSAGTRPIEPRDILPGSSQKTSVREKQHIENMKITSNCSNIFPKIQYIIMIL